MLNFGFLSKNFFPKFELPNSGCGLSVGAAYLQVFTVLLSLSLSLPEQCCLTHWEYCYYLLNIKSRLQKRGMGWFTSEGNKTCPPSQGFSIFQFWWLWALSWSQLPIPPLAAAYERTKSYRNPCMYGSGRESYTNFISFKSTFSSPIQ